MEERYYQPQLIWGYFRAWAERAIPEYEKDYRLQLFIFVNDGLGAYYMHGPKLYWKDDLGASHWQSCPQDALWSQQDKLGEVQGFVHRNKSKDPVHWKSFDAFVNDIKA